MFLSKSGNSLSLIMGVPNKTSLHHLDIVDPRATTVLNKLQVKEYLNICIWNLSVPAVTNLY